MAGDNATSGDNQQETIVELDPRWIVGFVDGEGCFCVSVHRNAMVRNTGGWQLHAAFQVYQHQRHRPVLEALQRFFGCGRVRAKGPNSSVSTFSVDSLRKLETIVVPFFERYPLVVKACDFGVFAQLVRAMRRREHLTADGFEWALRLAYGMNAMGKQRSRSLETILDGIPRDCTPGASPR